MQLRNVVVIQDSQGVILTVNLEQKVKRDWVKKTISLYDIIASNFVFDAVKTFIPTLELTAITGQEIPVVILPSSARPAIKPAQTIKLFGTTVAGNKLGTEMAARGLAMTKNMSKDFDFSPMGDSGWIELIEDSICRATEGVKRISDGMREMKLLRSPEDAKRIAGIDTDLAELYLDAIKIDILFRTEYTEAFAKKAPIKESDLVSPYNDDLRKYLVDGALVAFPVDSVTKRSELGQPVRLSIPNYADVFAYYNPTGDEIEELESDIEYDEELSSEQLALEQQAMESANSLLLPEDFENTAKFTVAEDPITRTPATTEEITIMVAAVDQTAVAEMIRSVDFTLAPVPSEECAEGAKGAMSYASPLMPAMYPVNGAFKHVNCFNVERIITDPMANPNNVPLEYIKGYDDACTVDLTQREQAWYERVKSATADTLMAEQEILSVDEANELVKDGIRSRCMNSLMKDMLAPILQLTRAYTGRVAYNAQDYKGTSNDDEDESDSGFESSQLCFYDVVNGKRAPTQPPTGYKLMDIGLYRSLRQSLFGFIDTYAKDTFCLAECVLRLLRSGEYKPTILKLNNALKPQKSESVPIYFDLNECHSTDALTGIGAVQFYTEQDLSFCIRMESPKLAQEFKNGSTLESSILGDNYRYEDGYIAGVGLWSRTDSKIVSRTDFLDIFTFVEFVKNKSTLNKCPINIINLKYDETTDTFSYIEPEDNDINANMNEIVEDNLDTGSHTLEAAIRNKMFDTINTTSANMRIKEYRTVIENMEYLKIRGAAAQQCNIKNVSQDTNFGIFVQLNRVINDVHRLDQSLQMYSKFGEGRLPANMQDMSRYAEALLDVKYTARFLQLVGYCQSKGVKPHCDMVVYLNTVNQFMTEGTKELGHTTTLDINQYVANCTEWFQGCLPINGKTEIAFWLGQMLDATTNKRKFVVIENSASTKELRMTIARNVKEGKATVGAPRMANALFTAAIKPYLPQLGKNLLAANSSTISWIEQIIKRYIG